MAGELWRQSWQWGKETVYGTYVPATRVMYGTEVGLTRARDPRPYPVMTGTRDNVRGYTQGPVQAGGMFNYPVSADEMVEPLLIGMKGGVTPTTPAMATLSRLWTFTPGTSLDSAAIEWNDGARDWRGTGMYCDQMTIQGSVNQGNTVSCTLFGANAVLGAGTGALAQRTPTYMDGWQTRFFIDAFGSTPGTTEQLGVLLNWNVSFQNGLARKYTAGNTLAASGVTLAPLTITAQLTFEASPAVAATEYANWDAMTKRILSLQFQDETAFIETTFRRFVQVDLPGNWSSVDLGQTADNTRVYAFNFQYVYDPTNAYGVRVRLQNARTAAW